MKGAANRKGERPVEKHFFASGLLVAFFCLWLPVFTLANDPGPGAKDPEDDYAETSITLGVRDLGSFEVPAVISQQTLYLSVPELFTTLQIRHQVSAGRDSIEGFFPKPDNPFFINRRAGAITYAGKTFKLAKDDIIVTASDVYLKADLLGKVFGLNIRFNFRSLSAELVTSVELPALRELRLEQVRQNINRLKGNPHADSVVQARHPGFHFGMAEWGFIDTKALGGTNDLKATLGLGSVVAGGETNLGLYYHSSEKFSERQQFYQWRHVNNDNDLVKQLTLGKIPISSISTIYNPVVGGQVTNAPTYYRKSYGTYPTSGFTEPNWIVELFVNGELVDYKKADASGFYSFDIPVVFGNSNIQLKFYGPFGEERSRELTISIPYNFLPYHEMQYVLSGGMVEDSLHSRYFRSSIGYGLNRMTTVGAGVEYLSSVTSGSTMPFVNASFRLTSSLILSGDYVYGVRSRGILDYRLPSNALIELNYTKYVPGQTAINYNYLEERKLIFTMPFHTRGFSAFSRLSVDQVILPLTRFVMADYLISAGYGHFSTNITTFASLYQQTAPYYYSNIALSYRSNKGFVFTPSVQYEYLQHDLLSVRLDVEKRILKNGYFNLSFERDFKTHTTNAFVGFRYVLPWAQTSSDVRRAGPSTYLEEAASGSFIYDKAEKVALPYNRPVVGRAAISISCFLDLNGNGVRDKNEPRVEGLRLHFNAGTVLYDKKDTTYRIYDLEPYLTYYTEFESGFQNIAWQLKIHSLNIKADPNQIKSVEIPVLVRAEVSGTVNYTWKGQTKGLGRMIVGFFNSKSKIAGRVMTESDGSYSYLGLAPGTYTVHIDADQMRRLGLLAKPEFRTIHIDQKIDGDQIDRVDFEVFGGNKTFRELKDGPQAATESEILSKDEVTAGEKKDIIAIQTIAFGTRDMAYRAKSRLERGLRKPVMLFYEGNYFKLRITGIKNREEASRVRTRLGRMGFYGVIFPASSKFKPALPL